MRYKNDICREEWSVQERYRVRTKENRRSFGKTILETARERITLLKAGIREKNIQRLYIVGNDMKVINGNLLYTADDDKIVDNNKG